MGRRAIYAMISDGVVEYRSSPGGAPAVPRQVAWGPQWFALETFFADEVNGLATAPWAEAGVAADFDRQRLRVYGGESLPNCAGLQRWFVRLLSTTWSGWDVDWARGGARDLVVPSPGGEDFGAPQPLHEPSSDWLEIAFGEPVGLVITVRDDAGDVRNYRVDAGDNDVEQILAVGPTDLAARLADRKSVRLPREIDVPSGVFMDSTSHRVSYWYSVAKPDRARALDALWPGWQIERQVDGYTGQLEASGQLGSDVLLSRSEVERELTAELAVGSPGREAYLQQKRTEAAAEGRSFAVSELVADALAEPMTPARQRARMHTESTGTGQR